jgi:hypothetical protein
MPNWPPDIQILGMEEENEETLSAEPPAEDEKIRRR